MGVKENLLNKISLITDGEQRVFESGKKAEYDAFWDGLQNHGDGTADYRYMFWYWPDEIYNPKYPIYSTKSSMISCFQNAAITNTKVDIDISKTNTANGMFTFCKVRTIPKLIVSEKVTVETMFSSCNTLEDLTVEGYFGTSITFASCTKLKKPSIVSVINALSPNKNGLTVTLSLASVQKAFETSEGANDGNTSAEWKTLTDTKTNWTISLV